MRTARKVGETTKKRTEEGGQVDDENHKLVPHKKAHPNDYKKKIISSTTV